MRRDEQARHGRSPAYAQRFAGAASNDADRESADHFLRQSPAPRTQNGERNGNNQGHDQDRCFQQSIALVGRDAENFFDEIHMDLCFP